MRLFCPKRRGTNNLGKNQGGIVTEKLENHQFGEESSGNSDRKVEGDLIWVKIKNLPLLFILRF